MNEETTQSGAERQSGANSAQVMRDGTETKALFIKHLALEDWETLGQIRAALGGKTVAEAVRWAIRKAGGKL